MSNLSGYALISLDEAKRELKIDTSKNQEILEDAINRATFDIEAFLGCDLVSRGWLTEFHTPESGMPELYLRAWPIISVTTVHEDSGRDYPASSLLTETTDYIVSKPRGALIRVSGSGKSGWETGFRAIKVVYAGGYTNEAAVPHDIKGVGREYTALIYREVVRGEQNISGLSDSTGNITRFGPARLTESMKQRLWPHRSVNFGGSTWERD